MELAIRHCQSSRVSAYQRYTRDDFRAEDQAPAVGREIWSCQFDMPWEWQEPPYRPLLDRPDSWRQMSERKRRLSTAEMGRSSQLASRRIEELPAHGPKADPLNVGRGWLAVTAKWRAEQLGRERSLHRHR
jgi:hypothetical protein